MEKITSIIVLVAFGISLFAQKVKIEKAEDLPTHYYDLEDPTAMNYINDNALAIRLANEIEKNLLADLEKYDIKDRATLREYEGMFETISFIKKDYKKALMHLKKDRALSEKESEKYMNGMVGEAYLLAKLDPDVSNEKEFKAALKRNLSKALNAAPYEVVKEEVEGSVGTLGLVNKNLYQGMIEGSMQPVLDNSKGQVPQSAALGLLGIKMAYNVVLPYAKEIYQPVFQEVYDRNHKEVVLEDIWEERDVIFENEDQLKPVVIGVWDAGVDVDALPKNNQWKNSKEKPDGKDNDGNGFIDDMYGIAFDEEGYSEKEVLLPAKKINPEIEKYQRFSKGLGDLRAAVKSVEAEELKKHMAAMQPEEVNPFIENLGLYGNYSHGTHVAGIAAKGNPQAQILTARLTFTYKNIPPPPTLEKSKNWAKLYEETIEYFKQNKVRVVNMSWGYSQNWYESRLAENGIGENEEERKKLAKQLFALEKDALYEAMKNAPEILFVCAAGNANDDIDFANRIPSGFILPNLMKTGAVDIEGKETGFTTSGKSVDVYANGYEVESYVPGGIVQKKSGTSMSSPQVANLAGKIWAMYPELSVQDVKTLIIKGATSSKANSDILLIHPKRSLEFAKKGKLKESLKN